MSTNDRPFPIVTLLLLGVCLVAALLAYFLLSRDQNSNTEAVKSISQQVPIPTPVVMPIKVNKSSEVLAVITAEAQTTPEPTPTPLPKLNDSDVVLRNEITSLNLLGALAGKLTPDEIIRKSVRAIYNLSKGNVVQQYRPLEGPAKQFNAVATGKSTPIASSEVIGEFIETPTYQMGAANFQRYQPYVELINRAPLDSAVQLYRAYYPLLQQAYEELGEGPSDFNQVVIDTLTNLLATPEPKQEPILIRTSVLYKYLDPALERLPNSQKLMLRLGTENRASVKLKLKELKSLLERTEDKRKG